MIVSNKASLLWRQLPADLHTRMEDILRRHPGATVFFRADDVAIPSIKQDRLLGIFARHDAPLCAALVPAWMTVKHWEAIARSVQGKHHLFAWHQHGWNHLNHESAGKKQEFGPGANPEQKRRAIIRGRDKLVSILGNHFLPVFTPPWNRLDPETIGILLDAGFRAISRYRGDKLPSLPGLPDLPVNVDLHTRKETSPEAGWDAFLAELDQALASGRVGFMLHHQRMNEAAFDFLDALLPMLRAHTDISLVHFGEILGNTPVTTLSTP